MRTSKLVIFIVLVFCVSTLFIQPNYALPITPSNVGASGIGPTYYPPIQPASGPQKTLAILVEFSDVKHSVNTTTIDSMIFGQMAKYYYNVSYGQIQVVGKSVGWYQLSHPMSYYGADTDPSQPGSDTNPVQLMRDAIAAAEPDVDFNAYSKIVVIHAGVGQEDAATVSNDIWSEAYWFDLNIQANNGAVVNAVAIAPELESHGHSPLGVYTHEYGHLLGLLDLYEYNAPSGVSDPFVSRWSLMATGVWLGDPPGSSPAELDAWSRIKLGWIIPDGVQLPTDNLTIQLVTLHPLETTSGTRALKITTNSSTNYYLVELRERLGFDEGLPSSGVLITRIDETRMSGGGIVQVVDANTTSKTLNDAPYQVGETFRDPARHVFITILSKTEDAITLIVANQERATYTLQYTQIVAPYILNATYLRPTTVSAMVANRSGAQISGLPVRLQYYDHEQWFDIDTNQTNSEGIVRFVEHFAIKPGEYHIRFLFTGGKFGDLYLAGSDQLATLNLSKLGTEIQFSGPSNVQANEPATITFKITDEFNNLIPNLQADVWLDNKLVASQRLVNGTMNIQLSFGFYQLGKHNLTVAVDGNPYYGGSTSSLNLNAGAPIWIYEAFLGIAILAISVAYLVLLVRKRPKGKRRRWVRRKR